MAQATEKKSLTAACGMVAVAAVGALALTVTQQADAPQQAALFVTPTNAAAGVAHKSAQATPAAGIPNAPEGAQFQQGSTPNAGAWASIGLLGLGGALLAARDLFAPAKKDEERFAMLAMAGKSEALPWVDAPAGLDGTEIGDVGFDPAGFTSPALNASPETFRWYREAELQHGRVAMLAIVGNLWPGLVGYWPGNPDFGVPLDAFANTNPITALDTVPGEALGQLAIFFHVLETARYYRVFKAGKEPGDAGVGQFGWNPLRLNYTPEEFEEKQLQEIKHCRLAMLGIAGMFFQARVSGMGIVDQLGQVFTFPEARTLLEGPGYLGDYFPPGL